MRTTYMEYIKYYHSIMTKLTLTKCYVKYAWQHTGNVFNLTECPDYEKYKKIWYILYLRGLK